MDKTILLKQVQERPWAIHRPVLEAALARLAAGIQPAALEAARGVARSGMVGVIPISGIIRQKGPQDFMDMLFGGSVTSTERVSAAMRQFMADPDVGSILLDIDSPGGEVYGVAELGAEIYKARGSKPIIAIANSAMFSAAYWIGSQADELVVTPGGEVGSIGVWTMHIDWSKWDEQAGIDVTYISAGKYKVAGNPDEPLSDETLGLIQADVDRYYGMFVDAVARGRNVKPADVRSGFGEGWIVGAKDAVKLGMADRVGTLRETLARLGASEEAPRTRAMSAETELEIAAWRHQLA